MAKQCDICGKKPQVGHNISHAHNLSKRRFNPNLHRMKIQLDGRVKKVSVCTSCLRSGKITKVV